MRKICIIGGSGFIGTRLISVLNEEYDIRNLDKVTSIIHPDVTCIGDVRDRESLVDHLQGRELVILLAAEHLDNVSPTSLYYDVNVTGMRNVLDEMDHAGLKAVIFTSSVAVYGINHVGPCSESTPAAPNHHYGKSKWQAELILQEWVSKGGDRRALIIRPTVIFGEHNRGNVYNLFKQIYEGKFLMVGNGQNRKSMGYVGNLVAFIRYKLLTGFNGLEIFNYADKPDYDMNTLVSDIYRLRLKPAPRIRIPYSLGVFGGYCFDLLAKVTGKVMPISSIRIKKFCSSTEVNADRLDQCGFKRPFDFKKSLRRLLTSDFE